jgi:acyl-coenzyme A thioesterase PaaI-like protein
LPFALTINLLRRPSAEHPITGVCQLIKVGRTLAVGTCSIPPQRA